MHNRKRNLQALESILYHLVCFHLAFLAAGFFTQSFCVVVFRFPIPEPEHSSVRAQCALRGKTMTWSRKVEPMASIGEAETGEAETDIERSGLGARRCPR